jgi:hypothetical protein
MTRQITIEDLRAWGSCYTKDGNDAFLLDLFPAGEASPRQIIDEERLSLHDRGRILSRALAEWDRPGLAEWARESTVRDDADDAATVAARAANRAAARTALYSARTALYAALADDAAAALYAAHAAPAAPAADAEAAADDAEADAIDYAADAAARGAYDADYDDYAAVRAAVWGLAYRERLEACVVRLEKLS